MEEDGVVAKQNYLREMILEKGYDADMFSGFLEKKNPEAGVDINKWTLENLKLAVDEFCSQYESKQDINTNINNTIPNQENIQNIEPKLHMEAILNNSTDTDKNDNELTYIKCKRISETEISKTPHVNVTVSFPEIVETGFFSSKYVTYLVTTSPFDFKVRRRYSDFVWLRDFFNTHFIFSALPPLPKKNYGDRFSDFLITKRARALQKFITSIITNPLIRNSHALYAFLSIGDEEEWISKKSEFDQMKPQVISLNKVTSLNGKLDCTITPDKESKLSYMKDNIISNEILLKQLLISYKDVLLSLVTVSDKMRENAEIWNQLYLKSVSFKEHQKVKEVYHVMNKLMDEWGSSITNQVSLINLHLREFFRYVKNEYGSMKEIVEQCEVNRNLYYKVEEKLTAKKEELYKKQDIVKWELEPMEIGNKVKLFQNKDYAFSKMLPKETKHMNNVKATYGACLNATIEEFNRLRDVNGKRYPQQMCSFSNANAKIITDFHVAHVDVLAVNT